MNKLGHGILQLAWKPVLKSIRIGGKKLFSKKYLLYTNTALTVGLSLTGDVIQQNFQICKHKNRTWDKTRTFHVSCTGFLVGPFCHFWYMFLDRWLPGRTLRIVFKKILVDQLVCSPLFIGMFLMSLNYMENDSWDKVKQDLVEKGKTLYLADWIVWPPAQLINFLFLPTRYRVLYDNTIAFGFDCYFSYVRYDKVYPQDDHTQEAESEDTHVMTTVDKEDSDSWQLHVNSEQLITCDKSKSVSGDLCEQHIFS
ncbi:mpv17-like protein 2 [Haliotis cracherodii]|uniref:mpv17-like protein 2 n=1 Tax=Haliotis cracherodii TaxID=6455 RepID=UPI0039E7F543